MKNLSKFICIAILISTLFTGCNNPKFEEYTGKTLTIGVIGEIPIVREKNITFNKITLNDLNIEDTFKKNNAIFITKENLDDASKKEYSSIYTQCKIPFFFIEDTKGYLPFIDEDLSYEAAPEASKPASYITAILKENDTLTYKGFGLYNDIENKKNIEDVYSRVFITISENQSK